MSRRSFGGFGGLGPSRLLLIGAVICFVLQLLEVTTGVDLLALGLALGFASFLF
jgi:hypothetical protein